jgi:hypothetical protein
MILLYSLDLMTSPLNIVINPENENLFLKEININNKNHDPDLSKYEVILNNKNKNLCLIFL